MTSTFDAPAPREATISLAKANVYALTIIVPMTIVIAGSFSALWGIRLLASGVRSLIGHPFYSLLLLAAGAFVHELIHGLAWMRAGRKEWRSISFGFDVKTLTPFAHCSSPMNARAYRIGALAPGVLLGMIPATLGIAIGQPALMLFGLTFTIAAGGDFLVLWLLRGVQARTEVEDHPTKAGCIIHDSEATSTPGEQVPVETDT